MEAQCLLQALPADPDRAAITSLITREEMRECYAELKKVADDNMMATV